MDTTVDKPAEPSDAASQTAGPQVEIIESADGTKKWYLNKKLHRTDGPAIQHADGGKEWCFKGRRHREDGPAIERAACGKVWYLHNVCHREGGPAIERANGDKEWYRDGKLHREDGPAIMHANGRKQWFSDGKEIIRELPVIVAAPIVIDPCTGAGTQPFVDFVDSLKGHSNTDIAAKEGERLHRYFNALSRYLKLALKAVGKEAENLKPFTDKKALRGIFNAIAAHTHNTLISSVAILPSNIKSAEGPASYLFSGYAFNVGYNYRGSSFSFGFMQIFEGGQENGAKSSTTFPTFIIDHKMMEAVAPFNPLPMLGDLQTAMTQVNHDMLHHFTLPIINATIAHKFLPNPYTGPVKEWSNSLPEVGSGETYEHWAQMGHEKALLATRNAAQTQNVTKMLNHYFEELKRIGKETMGADQSPDAKGKARKVIDFYGMVMAHALIRVFPLNHPVISHCFDRLKSVDPLPEDVWKDCACTWIGTHKEDADRSEVLAKMRLWAENGFARDTIRSYKKQGLDILPEKDDAVEYAQLKLLQLLSFSEKDIHPHIPDPVTKMADLRKAIDRKTLDMIASVAKVTEYKP